MGNSDNRFHNTPTMNKNNSIIEVVDKLSKNTHFISIRSSATEAEVTQVFFKEIFKYHSLSYLIISDKDPKFTSKFWKSFFKIIETKLEMLTLAYLQTDRQTERTNRILEEVLHAYVNYKQDNWVDILLATEFSYNNLLQESTGYTPFQLDNGYHSRTSLSLINKKINPMNIKATQELLEH
ncbi:10801_t:CDS:1 [Scutellospora calospora]|uniref:10801_t:CDS:1 n=1 Tax=Scutellospora calospora TaxID=85575 RepID=A0ACA9N6T4_9GLOM|nr:10801_t:CDS:1 [Scutellospora calospora]